MKQTINLKLNKPDLTDAADITQLNGNWDVIDSEINILENRGYKAPKNITGTDLNNFKTTGFWLGQNLTNSPQSSVGSWWNINTYEGPGSGTYFVQEAWCLETDVAGFKNKKFVRYCNANNWTVWEEIATTETANITLLNGWRNYGVNCVVTKTGSTVSATGRMANGVTTAYTAITSLPWPIRDGQLVVSFWNSSGAAIGSGIISGNSFSVVQLSTNDDVNFNFTYTTV